MAFMFLGETIRTYRERDPAARSWLEVLLCYPGLHAVMWHRLSHWLWQHLAVPHVERWRMRVAGLTARNRRHLARGSYRRRVSGLFPPAIELSSTQAASDSHAMVILAPLT